MTIRLLLRQWDWWPLWLLECNALTSFQCLVLRWRKKRDNLDRLLSSIFFIHSCLNYTSISTLPVFSSKEWYKISPPSPWILGLIRLVNSKKKTMNYVSINSLMRQTTSLSLGWISLGSKGTSSVWYMTGSLVWEKKYTLLMKEHSLLWKKNKDISNIVAKMDGFKTSQSMSF